MATFGPAFAPDVRSSLGEASYGIMTAPSSSLLSAPDYLADGRDVGHRIPPTCCWTMRRGMWSWAWWMALGLTMRLGVELHHFARLWRRGSACGQQCGQTRGHDLGRWRPVGHADGRRGLL